jgi:hypothetical protein
VQRHRLSRGEAAGRAGTEDLSRALQDRFGFSAAQTAAFRMPGPYQRDRLLACELVPGALRGAGGLIAAASPPPSRLSGLMDRIAGS